MSARPLEPSKLQAPPPKVTAPAAPVAVPSEMAANKRPAADAVRSQLQQKDELILALTEQLEQAAEQLDRLQRQGADRRRGATVAGLPGDLVDQQRHLCEELQRVVHQWEDMQASLTLGRLEIQITELRDLVVQGQNSAPAVYKAPPPAPSVEIYHEPTELSSTSHVDSQNPALTEWERLKSQLLEQPEVPAVETAVTSDVPPLPDPPAPVQFDKVDVPTLTQAVLIRDEYITRLRERLRHTEVLQPTADLLQMDPDSAEFLQRVRWLEQRLEEHLRSAEVELSIERARMARDRAKLAQEQEIVERQLRKLGLSSGSDIEQVDNAASNPQERRWARFLGRGRTD